MVHILLPVEDGFSIKQIGTTQHNATYIKRYYIQIHLINETKSNGKYKSTLFCHTFICALSHTHPSGYGLGCNLVSKCSFLIISFEMGFACDPQKNEYQFVCV